MATARVSRKWVIERAEDKMTWLASELSARKERRVKALTRPKRTVFGLYSIMSTADAINAVEAGIGYRIEQSKFERTSKQAEKLLKLAEVAKGDLTLTEAEVQALL